MRTKTNSIGLQHKWHFGYIFGLYLFLR